MWAFGVLVWEMYSGRRAWLGLSYTQVMQAVGYEQRAPDWPADAPPELAVSALCTCVHDAVCMPVHVYVMVSACLRMICDCMCTSMFLRLCLSLHVTCPYLSCQ